MLHTILGEGIVGFGAVDKRVEEVLHVPEGNADNILSRNLIIGNKTCKTQKTNQIEAENANLRLSCCNSKKIHFFHRAVMFSGQR